MRSNVKLRVWGDFACFTRPELKVERVSYDVITPSAARGILDAIYWKPEIRWVIDRVHVLKPIRFTNVRRNEVGTKIPARPIAQAMGGDPRVLGIHVEDERQQRASTILQEVDYAIEAHFRVLGGTDPQQKHYEMFRRRADKGQCFHHPYLGCREFACDFAWIAGDPPSSPLAGTPEGNRDLGFMLHDIDFESGMTPRFFHAVIKDGIIEIPSIENRGVRS